MSSHEHQHHNVLLSAIGTRTILNFACKLIFRFLHFFLNALVLRYVAPDVIGIAHVRLQLLYTTILFLSREAFRRSVPKLKNLRALHCYVNLAWLVIPAGLCVITVALPLTLFVQTANAAKLAPFYWQACTMYALAALIELISEPFYLLATVTLNYQVNIWIEMFASTVGFSLQALLIVRHPESALFYYGLGYIIYSLLVTLTYYSFFITRRSDERRRLFLISSFGEVFISPTSPFVDHALLSETLAFFKQGIWMKLLTEGERYIMSLTNLLSYTEQGVFDTINNLGSLLPRLVFSTLEESAYTYFQQSLSRTKPNETQTAEGQRVHDDEMLVKRRSDDQTNVQTDQQPPTPTENRTIVLNAFVVYTHLLRFVIVISLLVITFGIPYSSFLLRIYGGTNLSVPPGPSLLRLYCIYILFLAVNGITEAFSQATMSLVQLSYYKHLISMFAIGYLIVFYLLTRFIGIHGIIVANCLNMSARIITNSYYIHRYFRGVQWSNALRFSPFYLLTCALAFSICWWSESWLPNPMVHFGLGLGLGLAMVAVTWQEEREMIHYLYCILRLNSRKPKQS